MIKKNYFFWGILLITVTLSGMLLMYQLVYSPVLPGSIQSKTIRIPSGTDFKGLLILLEKEKVLSNTTVFSLLSEKMNFKEGKVKSGQYKINKGINLIQLIRKLRSGNQEPVNVVLTTERM
ncbi:MAG: endolytic transglycosylase MltG, partial [Saprospiraceae bacterium]|nr:endolytic transglycosylase MltG [Saprospiraceae bacterium]